MTRWLLRRLAGAIPLLFGVVTLVFFAAEAMPGDALDTPGFYTLDAAAQARLRATFGLDQPLPVRYVRWLGATVRGDFGVSYARRRPVAEILAELLPNTLLLTGSALALGFLAGTMVGVWQARRRGSTTDQAVSFVSLLVYSMPTFWVALLAVLVFAYGASAWGWPVRFPASGILAVDHDQMTWASRLLDRLRHLALPVGSLTVVLAAGVARYARSSVAEELEQEYVRAARARGLAERAVVWRHALANALLPLITLLGLYLPLLLSGAVFVETVFAWPGLGGLMVSAIGSRDTPVLMACAVLFATLVVLGNLVADVLYGMVDPRVRHG